jgi:hypothetical protein
MSISGSPPVGSSPAIRAARAYGVAPKAPARPPESSASTAAAGKVDAAGEAEALRSILTDEERAYFDQLSSLGAISYAPGRRQGVPLDAPRGLRLDVTG